VAEAGFVASDDLADEIERHVQVDLRARQSDVPEVRGEQGQLRGEVGALLVPGEQPQNGEGVTIMPISA